MLEGVACVPAGGEDCIDLASVEFLFSARRGTSVLTVAWDTFCW